MYLIVAVLAQKSLIYCKATIENNSQIVDFVMVPMLLVQKSVNQANVTLTSKIPEYYLSAKICI